ncbi:MAG: nucleotidyltransferase substrate binding protein [Bacteroidales bacterium]|nr:nucleotidyltransferase substrate binding protein [Bacteroidales bacterium]MCF8333665.1 nucleotidyltransferase substrate binding protein [Bacteroidales bacterium]
MNQPDIRWKQRFQNYKNALSNLKKAMEIENPDIVQKAGLIQFFEITYELAWNLMKDYLQEQGYIDVKSPRSAIKRAFESELISDGHKWLELLNDRNLTAHTYDEDTVEKITNLIKGKYYPLLEELEKTFKRLEDGQ